MMGPEKLTTIRKRVRESFQMTDAELLAWFNKRIDAYKRNPQDAKTELETLRLFRDALLREGKVEKTRRKRPSASARNR